MLTQGSEPAISLKPFGVACILLERNLRRYAAEIASAVEEETDIHRPNIRKKWCHVKQTSMKKHVISITERD